MDLNEWRKVNKSEGLELLATRSGLFRKYLYYVCAGNRNLSPSAAIRVEKQSKLMEQEGLTIGIVGKHHHVRFADQIWGNEN